MADLRKWRKESCVRCSGHGVVSSYTFDGSDFLGPEECDDCGGYGVVWVHRKTGTMAQYPGGRLMGRRSIQPRAKEV